MAVIFHRGEDGFEKARRPWREALHPRGFGGRFGETVDVSTRRRRQAPGQGDLFGSEAARVRPPHPAPPWTPTTRRGQWADAAPPLPPLPPPVPPMPLRGVLPDRRQAYEILAKTSQAFFRRTGKFPTREETEAAVAADLAKKRLDSATVAGANHAWIDVVGAYPQVGEWVRAVRPGYRMEPGVLGHTSFGDPPGSDVVLRRKMPNLTLDDAVKGGSTASWDPARVAEIVTTHELGHALWFHSLWNRPGAEEKRAAEARMRHPDADPEWEGGPSGIRRRIKALPPPVPSPTDYGNQDGAEHFAEIFTVTRLYRDAPPRHMAGQLLPGVWEKTIEEYDAYVDAVVTGDFFDRDRAYFSSMDWMRRAHPTAGSLQWMTKAAILKDDAIVDDFGFGDLSDAELDRLGVLTDDEDDEPVVFVRGPEGFVKAARRPWQEALHPRGFGGKFGHGVGHRRHDTDTLDRPSGLGRRDHPVLAPRPKTRLGLQEIPAHLIHAGNNDRKEFDPAKLSELARSIDQDGIAFPPVVRPHPTIPGHFEIVGGERRVRAMRDVLGWDAVPVNVKHLTDEQASMMMLAENTVRDDLKPIDEARGYRTRMDEFGLTPEELADRTKLPVRRIRERLDLLALEPQIQDLVNAGQFPLGHARLMRDLDANRQRTAMQTYNAGTKGGGTMTVATFRQVVAKLQGEQDQQGLGFDMGSFMQNEDVDAGARAAEEARLAALAAKRAKQREPILGTKEIGALHGAKPATVQQWKSRGRLPPPDQVVSGIPLWYESTLEGWRPPGRVRKAWDWLTG